MRFIKINYILIKPIKLNKTIKRYLIHYLIQKDALFDWFSANWTFRHAITAHLACAVSAHEYHVLQTIQANRAHGLFEKKL